jgi:hypothetical protein
MFRLEWLENRLGSIPIWDSCRTDDDSQNQPHRVQEDVPLWSSEPQAATETIAKPLFLVKFNGRKVDGQGQEANPLGGNNP